MNLQMALTLKNWVDLLSSKALIFQFEIKKQILQLISQLYYGSRKERTGFIEDIMGLKMLLFPVLCDISAYIQYQAQKGAAGLNAFDMYKEGGNFFGEDDISTEIFEQYEQLLRMPLDKLRQQVYFEDIGVVDLWKDYVFNGCLVLLSKLLEHESEHLKFTFAKDKESFSNICDPAVVFCGQAILHPV